MKVIQKVFPKKFNYGKKAAKVGEHVNKLSLKEQYLRHITQEVNEAAQVSPIPFSFEGEITKKSKRQLVRDLQYLEKMTPKSPAVESPQLSKVVKHLPFLMAYNNQRPKDGSLEESASPISSKKKNMDARKKVDNVHFVDDEDDKRLFENDEGDSSSYSEDYVDDDELYTFEDAKALDEIRKWRDSFE